MTTRATTFRLLRVILTKKYGSDYRIGKYIRCARISMNMEQETIINDETGGIRLPRNQQEFQILHWTWSMTTQDEFETTFNSIEPYHVGGYLHEQWTIWHRRPLEFMAKWPTIAVQLIRDYEQRRNDYIKNK